jgi:hypothetical protein
MAKASVFSRADFVNLYVNYKAPMSKGLVVFLQILETLQVLTIAITPDETLPINYDSLGPLYAFINYVSRPDVLLETIGSTSLIVSAVLGALLIIYYLLTVVIGIHLKTI